jgi:hypothetical protein
MAGRPKVLVLDDTPFHSNFLKLYEPVAQPGDIKFVNQTSASIEPKASLTHQM